MSRRLKRLEKLISPEFKRNLRRILRSNKPEYQKTIEPVYMFFCCINNTTQVKIRIEVNEFFESDIKLVDFYESKTLYDLSIRILKKGRK